MSRILPRFPLILARLNQVFEFQVLNPEAKAGMNQITLVEKEQNALQLSRISPAGAVTEGATVCHTYGACRVPADVLGCLLVGAVDQEDTMVSRYVAARED